jgi:NAD(P)-dependent dehydrogenase (short-subunit alcohol dehydrogenase family)
MVAKTQPKRRQRPPQHQRRQPGLESHMRPEPEAVRRRPAAGKRLAGRVALITGGDSGIGKAVAVTFAREGAHVAIAYLSEHDDARTTAQLVEATGQECLRLPGDIGHEPFCRRAVRRAIRRFGRLDILVNNAAEQHPTRSLTDITAGQLRRTFQTNIFSFFYLAKATIPHLPRGGAIINTTSVTAYRGSPSLVDYASTKGAIVGFTRSLAMQLVERGIRVNAVAPGPIWTPLIPSTFPPQKVASFGSEVPIGRAGEPAEIAPCYVFLACDDSSYMTGQVLHPNGGEIVNG